MKIPIDKLIYSSQLPPDRTLIKSIEKFDKVLPIIVAIEGDRFRVHIGNRSVAALKLLGQTEVEAIISELDGSILTLIGNLQRSDNPIAEGEAIQSLLDNGWTKEEIRDHIGIPLHKQYGRLRLLHNLIPKLRKKIADGKMSCEAGKIATNLSKSEQEELAQEDKITISRAKSARRTKQLTMLDLESVTIPRISELDQLFNSLTKLCTKLEECWERTLLIEAIKAIESLRGE
ncbi:MAG: hypothetical protein H8D67_30995 [Deltaproteobacteria bacterium]|nr:hypothetical protein [Deltaproteobacteria bacterium]